MDAEGSPLKPSIPERFQDDERIEAAMKKAVINAMRVHKFFRIPWIVWRDGKVVSIPPEEIPVNEADFDEPPTMPNW